MSAYHPPSSFGGPFNAQPQYPPSSGGNNAVIPPFQYQQMQDPNLQRHGIPPTHFANAYSFHSNAHTPNPPIPSNGVPNTSFAGYDSVPHSSFPPPPFPPVPIPPYGTFPHPAPLMHHPVIKMSSVQPPNSLPRKPPPPPGPGKLLDMGSETPTNAVAATSDLEDGELSDGESTKYSKEHKLGYTSSPRPQASKVNENRQQFRRVQSHHANSGNRSPNGIFTQHPPRNHPRPKRFGQSPAQSPSTGSPGPTNPALNRRENDQDTPDRWTGRDAMHNSGPSSGARYSQEVPDDIRQPATTQDLNHSHPLASVRPPTNGTRSNTTTSNNDHNIIVKGYPPSNNKIATDIRERAKVALQELYPYKIGYTKLVQEGLDPSLLLELYNEMGIRPASPVRTKQNCDSAELQQATSIASKVRVAGDNLTRSDRPQLPQASPVATSIAIHNTTAQNPVVSVRHDLTTKQRKHEQIREDGASDQAPWSSQSSDVRPTPKPQDVKDKGPTLPRKASLLNETQVNNTNSVPVAAVATDTKADTTRTLISVKPSASSLPNNPVVAKSGDKTLERKDYIARMLAAKAGKPIPTSKAPSPSTTTITHEAKTSPQPPPSIDLQNDRIPEQRRLYLGNLARSTKEDDVRALFGNYSIEEISIPFNLRTAELVGYGFVQLSTPSEAQRAISELSGKIMHGRTISCQLAHKPEEASKAVEPAAQFITPISYEGSRVALAEQNASVEAKRKAQTDLARQKMEALKSRTVAQRETLGLGNIVPPAVRPQQLPEVPPSSAFHENLASVAQVSNLSPTTPHGSYFSPINERQPFSIPGLFMASARPLSIENIEQPMTTAPAPPQEIHQATTSILSTDGTVHPKTLLTPTTSSPLPSGKPGSIFTSETLDKSSNSASKVNEPRKRQRASDFIDSPPRKINRTLGHKEDVSVIIDVSEEEVNDSSEDDADAMDIEQDVNINPSSTQLEHDELETGKQRAIRDLPPLTDFPARKKIPENSAFMTPPAVQTPGKLKEPDSLKPKLMEIELMKRRIAELEQRNKAKQSSSRAQTPGTPGHARSSPRPVETLVEGNEQSKSSAEMRVPAGSVQEQPQAYAKGPTLSAPEITQKMIGLDDATEHQEIEKDLAVAASETLQLRQNVAWGGQQQGQSADCESEELQPAGVDSNRSKSTQATLLDEARLQLVEQPIKEIADAQAETDRLRAVEAAARADDQQRLMAEQRVKARALADAEVERSWIAQSLTGEEDQRRRRRTNIQSCLPILDAEVERTRQKLQSLRKQMEDLENEVQKGIDGRRILMDELARLSPAPSPTPKSSSQEGQGLPENPLGKPEIASKEEIQDSQSAMDDVHQRVKPVVSETTMTTNEVDGPTARTWAALSPPIHDVGQTGNGELAEDVMDISQSDVDEGEFTDYSPESPKVVEHQTPLPESEDTYEPPLTIDPVPLHTSTSQQGETVSHVAESNQTHVTPNGTQEGIEPSHDSEASNHSSEDTNESGEILAASRSQPLNDDSDPDDYEPPEPETPVEAPALPLNHDIDTADTSFSLPDPNALSAIQSLPISVTPAVQDRADNIAAKIVDTDYPTVDEPDSSSKPSRFTPYESPLKQFKSYRYHSNYVSEVSEGFRSLTYSHAIDPDKPICRYEAAGGRCNDDSCDSQHFRGLVLSGALEERDELRCIVLLSNIHFPLYHRVGFELPFRRLTSSSPRADIGFLTFADDKVLVQMGDTPAGFSPQETEAYVKGLRQIIQEIRGRKVKSFNKVAAEISAYRARFLGDGSKVLPLRT